jgi:hypothetical protein
MFGFVWRAFERCNWAISLGVIDKKLVEIRIGRYPENYRREVKT